MHHAALLKSLLTTYRWFDHPEGMKFVEVEGNAQRSVGHWLFQPGSVSMFHRVRNGDEIWAIHAGSLRLHLIDPAAGEHREVRLGMSVQAGERPVAMVPAGHWQAAELPEGVPLAFGSNVCAPGFSYDALELARRDELSAAFAPHAELITRLTPA